MDILDYQEVKKYIDILNVAYHLCLEIVEEKGFETKAICPFCGYNKIGMLKLEGQHRRYLRGLGLLDSSIDVGRYRAIPKNYIKRRIIGSELARKHNLAGIPGFFQEEDFKWCFNRYDGFFVPVFDENGYIQGLSIHLDKPFNNNQDIWFSSNNKINGTNAKSWIMKKQCN